MTRDTLRVAAAQYAVRPVEAFEEFSEQVTTVVETAARHFGSELLVFPEYFTLQLMTLGDLRRPLRKQIADVAAYLPQFVELMRGLARKHDLYIAAGTIPVVDEDSTHVYNDACLFAPSGDYGIQGKLRMSPAEEAWGVIPRTSLTIFETDFGRLAITVGHDVELPELARVAAQEDADLLIVPSRTGERHEHLRVRYCARARAAESTLYVIQSPLVGGLSRLPDLALHYGQAAIFTPCGYAFARDGLLAEGRPSQEDLVVGVLDLGALRHARSSALTRLLERRWPMKIPTLQVETATL